MMTYKEWEEASKEGEVCLLADSSNPNQPCPQAAAIRYRQKPSGGGHSSICCSQSNFHLQREACRNS